MTQAKPVKVSFLKRFSMGANTYEHEEMMVEYFIPEECTETALEVLKKARADVIQSSTAYLKAMKEKETKK